MTDLPDWLSDEDREFFRYAVPQIKRAARKHRLRIEPWFKDVAIWALHFRHPSGGTGQIVVELRDGRAAIEGYWWRDDFASETRHMAERVRRSVEWPASDLAEVIRDVLTTLLGLSEQDLVAVHQMPPGTWHQHFAERSLGSWERSLPKPKP